MAENAADLSFKVERAKQWKTKVMNEITMVTNLLKQVETEVQTAPFEDDTILLAFKKAAEALASSFKALNENFTKAVSGVDSIVDTLQTKISNLLQGIGDMVSKIGRPKGKA